jgi:hypothetical protein
VRRRRRYEHGIDRLLFGGIDETTCVDDDQIGELRRGDVVAGGDKRAFELSGVGFVLRTAERDDGETGGAARAQR